MNKMLMDKEFKRAYDKLLKIQEKQHKELLRQKENDNEKDND